jgi:hypothetical protein
LKQFPPRPPAPPHNRGLFEDENEDEDEEDCDSLTTNR